MDNLLYGKMMLDNANGIDSKMSLLACYLYYVVTCNNEELASLLKKFYYREQKHLLIFLRLANQLGADPRLWNYYHDHNEYWSPSYINYYQKNTIILDDIINKKMKLIKKYQYQIKRISNHHIQIYLKKIMMEEIHSISLLKEFRELIS